MLDIYFEPNYGKMCELVDGGEYCRYVLETEAGRIVNQFIKRPLPFLIDGVQYFDVVTPYGYGGPVIDVEHDHAKLLEEYRADFAAFCQENRIICEFIRFHPILRNFEDFESVYTVTYSRHTVGTNLKDHDDPVQSEFSKSARREVRKGEKAGVVCVINENPLELKEFRRLYEETLDRNHAEKMYYFPDAYYDMLTSDLREHVLEIQARRENEVIASEIYFVKSSIMHAHLLGSNSEFIDIGCGAILEAAAVNWGKARGFAYIHHGGGRSSAEDDPLYLYKKKFGKKTEFDFCVGKKVWNPMVYCRAVELRKAMGGALNESYFPVYRS